jgi:hypothetical protein
MSDRADGSFGMLSKNGGRRTYVLLSSHLKVSPLGTSRARQASSPAETRGVALLELLGVIAFWMVAWISALVGHRSFRKTSLPFLSVADRLGSTDRS